MSLNFIARDIQRVTSRPAVLLLHAYPMDHRMWLSVMDRLDGMPLLLVDAPGFGGSDPTVDTPSLEAFADEIASSLGRFGIEKVVAVGNSMGGYAALALGERHPKLVSGIAMIGSRADADTEAARGRRIENLVSILAGRREEILTPAVEGMFSEQTRRVRPEVVEQAVEWSREASREAISWAQRAISVRPDRMHVLETLGVPGLVMRGEEDALCPAEHCQEMALRLGTQVVEVRGAAHLIPIEDPGAVSRALMSLYPQCR